MSEIAQEKIDELKAAHPDVELRKLTSGVGDVTVIVRAPTRGEYQRYRSEFASGKKDVANENLVRSVIVHPTKQEFGAALNKLPALCEEFAGDVLELAGLTAKSQSEKL